MTAFLKSDLFLRFLGGFVVGTIAMFALQPSEPPALTSPAMASTGLAPTAPASTDRASL